MKKRITITLNEETIKGLRDVGLHKLGTKSVSAVIEFLFILFSKSENEKKGE